MCITLPVAGIAATVDSRKSVLNARRTCGALCFVLAFLAAFFSPLRCISLSSTRNTFSASNFPCSYLRKHIHKLAAFSC